MEIKTCEEYVLMELSQALMRVHELERENELLRTALEATQEKQDSAQKEAQEES